MVQLLIEQGAEVDLRDDLEQTPLARAATSGKEALVQLLIEKGAEVDLKDNEGRTPLSRAAEWGLESMVQFLIERDDVDISSGDRSGRTPLAWALKGRMEGWPGCESVIELLEQATTASSMKSLPFHNTSLPT